MALVQGGEVNGGEGGGTSESQKKAAFQQFSLRGPSGGSGELHNEQFGREILHLSRGLSRSRGGVGQVMLLISKEHSRTLIV